MSFEAYQNSQKILKDMASNSSTITAENTKLVAGIIDIADDFELIIFSPNGTLIANGQTLPAGAVCVPRLRKMGCKLAIYSPNGEDLTQELNRLGFSFAPQRIFNEDTLELLSESFPLTQPDRILFVTADNMNEVFVAHAHGLKTLLIQPNSQIMINERGLEPHYIADSL